MKRPVGQRLQSMTTPALQLTLVDKSFDRRSSIGWHAHDQAVLCVVLGGEMREETPDGVSRFSVGDAILKGPGVRHRNQFGRDGARILSVTLPRTLPGFQVTATGAPGPESIVQAPGVGLLGATVAARMGLRNRAGLMTCEGLALQLLGEVLGHQERMARHTTPAWVVTLHDTLLSSPSTHTSLAQLGADAGQTPSRLSRLFRERYGLSVSRFIHRARIETALRRLRDDHAPIADIAAALGYHDQSHFSRVFKRMTGLAPGQYRRLARR